MEKIRAFIAIELEHPLILEKIELYQNELQKSIGPLKLVRRDLMHLTLRFLGDISLSNAQQIYQFLQEDINSFYFTPEHPNLLGKLQGVGDFNKRVFFIKIQNCIDVLQAINQKIEFYLTKSLGLTPETKSFSPHLTIARSKANYRGNKSRIPQINTGQPDYPTLKAKYQTFEFGTWEISKIVLKKSVLTPKGPIYSNLKF